MPKACGSRRSGAPSRTLPPPSPLPRQPLPSLQSAGGDGGCPCGLAGGRQGPKGQKLESKQEAKHCSGAIHTGNVNSEIEVPVNERCRVSRREQRESCWLLCAITFLLAAFRLPLRVGRMGLFNMDNVNGVFAASYHIRGRLWI